MPIKTGLISYWSLGESSGNAVDSHGSNTLTQSGSPTSATGVVGNCRGFNGSTQLLSLTDNASISTGNINFSLQAWVRFLSKSNYQIVFAKHNGSTNAGSEYLLMYDQPSDRLIWDVRYASGGASVSAANFGSPPINTWFLVHVWHDATNDQIGISVNNGTPNTVSHTLGVNDSTATFRLGAVGVSPFWHLNGNLDEVAFWKKVLTPDERTILYNGGAGKAYANLDQPLNTAAPVLSGTEQEDQTLSCTTGTWDSQSNGALSYAYQWTRSNDSGGTGEANIIGATSSTYVLTATDVGKFIRCRVRASNNGGYDAAEDTNSNMSGAIAAAGGGSIDATLSATLEGVTASASAAAKIDASLTTTLEGATAASSVVALIAAGVSATLDGVSVVSTATVGNAPAEAALSATLDGVTASSIATAIVAAGVSATMEGVSGESTATVLIAAGVSATLDGVSVVSTATVGNVPGEVTLSATLDGVTGMATSVVLIEAGLSATLEGATAVSSATSLIAAGVTVTLEGVALFAMAGDGEEDDGGILLLMYRMLV
jgi:hypothetical protein